jgi:ATP-dependent Lhr-like helicase
MRRDGRLLLGRFVRGRVRYVRAKDAPAYVAAYATPLRPLDERVRTSSVERRRHVHSARSWRPSRPHKDEVKESIDRLDAT